MGQASSSPSILGPFYSSPRRFHVKQLTVGEASHANANQGPLICSADSADPVKITAQRADNRPLEFVLNNDEFMLKTDFQPLLPLRFKISLAVMPGDAIHSLTFITGMSRKHVDSLVNNSASELLSNPNLQNEENVAVLGDYIATDQPLLKQVDFTWTWEVPASSPPGGWPLYFCFAEYDKDEHVLKRLAGGSLWIAEQPTRGSLEMLLSPVQAPQHMSVDVLSPDNSLLSPVPDLTASAIPVLQPASLAAAPSVSSGDAKLGEPLLVPDFDIDKRQQAERQSMEPTNPLPKIKAQKPDPDRAVQPEDGPSFRSSLTDMESRMVPLKARAKQLLKRSLLVSERLQALVEAEQWLANAVVLAAESDMPALQPLIPWITAHWSQGAYATRLKLRKAYARELSQRILEPIREFYEQDVKLFDIRRKEFADESSQYYSWMSRYLSSTKKNAPKDAKYTEKRRQFELARFDYYSFLLDLHGGRSQQILLLRFAQYFQGTGDALASAGATITKNGKQSIDASVEDLKDALKEWQQQRLDRETKRRTLERSIATGGAADDDVPESSHSQVYKEGLLWALSRPTGVQNTQASKQQGLKWHKYWVVQSGGQVCEYTNWKQGMDLHNEPINLLVASVREAKNADRRFCFEVVTPQFKRIYQATSDEDMRAWIASISRGITSMLELNSAGGMSDPHLPQATIVATNGSGSSAPKKLETLTRKLSLKEHRPRVPPINTHWHGPQSYGAGSAVLSPGGPVSAPPQSVSSAVPSNFTGSLSAHPSSQTSSSHKSHDKSHLPPVTDYSKASQLLTKVQSISGNRTCADCGSSKNVDWVSLNTLAVLCIECSGTHRSLGTHISKVRSLNLDTFSPDWEAVILGVSNPEINKVWEQQADKANRARPQGGCQASSSSRLKFISEKYVEKQFTREVEKPNAALRRAIQDQDIVGALSALVSCANPNGTSDAGEPMIVDAVRCAPANSSVFPLAELLFVNGGILQAGSAAPRGLTENALGYLKSRFELDFAGSSSPPHTPASRGPSQPATHTASTAHMSPVARRPSSSAQPGRPLTGPLTSSSLSGPSPLSSSVAPTASSALTGPSSLSGPSSVAPVAPTASSALTGPSTSVSGPSTSVSGPSSALTGPPTSTSGPSSAPTGQSSALTGPAMPTITVVPTASALTGPVISYHSIERVSSGSNDGSYEDLHARRAGSAGTSVSDAKPPNNGSRSSFVLESPSYDAPLNHSRIRTK